MIVETTTLVQQQPTEYTGNSGECMGQFAHKRIAIWSPPFGQPGARMLTDRCKCATCGVVLVEKRWEGQ